MSAYHSKGNTGRANGKKDATKTPISREVALSPEAIRQKAKDGLLPLCVEVGLNTLEIMFEPIFPTLKGRMTGIMNCFRKR